MSQLCLRRKTTACSRNEAFALAMSFMPNHAAIVAATTKGTHTNPAFWSQSALARPRDGLRPAAERRRTPRT